MWPAYRQRERQSRYLQQLIRQNIELLHFYVRETIMENDVLKISFE